MNIIISGGTGFIGSNLCKKLLKLSKNINLKLISHRIKSTMKNRLFPESKKA